MNILVIHETEYIKKMVFEYQIIPEIWASKGHRVFVIDFETKWQKSGLFDFISRTKTIKNVKRAGKKKGVTLIRPGFIKIPVISRVSAAINHYSVIKNTILKYKIDVMFLYSVPTNGLQAIRAARVCKIPVYFRLLDVLHQLVPYKILSWPTYMMERLAYRKVDELTAITPKLTKYAIDLGADIRTTSYLPTGYDADLFFPKPKDAELMARYKINKTDQVVVFAGTLYNFSGLDLVLKYFAKHIAEFAHTRFLIIGHGQQEDEFKKIVKQNRLEKNVIMTGFIDYKLLNNYLNLADICINPFAINKITDIIFPSKIYQYLACGKPVIATRLPGLIDIFPDNNGKNNIYYYDADKIEELFRLVKKIKKIRIKDRSSSLQQVAKILVDRLEKLKDIGKKATRKIGRGTLLDLKHIAK